MIDKAIIVVRVYPIGIKVFDQMGLECFTKRLVLLFELADVFARGLLPDAVFVGIAIDQRDVGDQIRLLVGRESGEGTASGRNDDSCD